MFALLIVLARYGVYQSFFDTCRPPKGDLIAEVESPHGTYTIKVYVVMAKPQLIMPFEANLFFTVKIKDQKIHFVIKKENGLPTLSTSRNELIMISF
jgi:hypothetical protein